MKPPRRLTADRARRVLLTMVLLMLALPPGALAAGSAVDMTEVRRLARQPVDKIFSGVPISPITDEGYRKGVQGSPRPVVVVFYANRDEKSRNLATLARYLALEFSPVITFYGYRVTSEATVPRPALAALQKRYGLRQIPATLFYDNDRGEIELEKADYSVPALTEYRTPSLLFWRTYHQTVRDYITKHILD